MDGYFDSDFSRVTREHYITGMPALNWPCSGTSTGDWHSLNFWGETLRIALAGIQFPDTRQYLNEIGVYDATEEFRRQRLDIQGKTIWMADHRRAAADLMIKQAALGKHHNMVSLADWFPSEDAFQGAIDVITLATPMLPTEQGDLIDRWLEEERVNFRR